MIPDRKTRRSDLIDPPWCKDYYMKWSEMGIKRYWDRESFPLIIDVTDEPHLVVVHIDIASAVVIAALWMRYVQDRIEYTYYDKKKKCLYLAFEISSTASGFDRVDISPTFLPNAFGRVPILLSTSSS